MTARDVGIAVSIGGLDVLDKALERVRVVWGRSELTDQPDTSTFSALVDVTKAGWDPNVLPFVEGAEVVVEAVWPGEPSPPAAGWVVYRGAIADLELEWDDQTEHVHLKVTADDLLAEMAHVKVGDVPWPESPAEARVADIFAAMPPSLREAVAPSWLSPGAVDIPERLWLVRARDVDRQPVLALLQSIATSTDAGVYITPQVDLLDGGPARRATFHSLSLDHPGRVFALVTGLYRIQPAVAGAEVTVSADHLRRGPTYRRGRAQHVTDVTLAYGTDPNTPLELQRQAPGTAELRGARSLRISTELVDEDNAGDLASRVITRGQPSWRTESLEWDANDGGPINPEDTLLRFLSGHYRVGLSVLIEDLPAWVPDAGGFVYVEGGTIEYAVDAHDPNDGNPGRWIVGCDIVPANGIGRGVTYNELFAALPAMTPNLTDPAITYNDAKTVGV
jgi:hypothetical protein